MTKFKITTNKGEVFKFKAREHAVWDILADFRSILGKHQRRYFIYIKRGLFYKRMYTINDLEDYK